MAKYPIGTVTQVIPGKYGRLRIVEARPITLEFVQPDDGSIHHPVGYAWKASELRDVAQTLLALADYADAGWPSDFPIPHTPA